MPEDLLVDLFESFVSQFGPLVVLNLFGATTTYRQLGQQEAKAAEGLRRLGVQPGDRVALAMPNCPQHVVGLPAPDGGEEVVAAVVLEEGAPFDEGAIRTACKERLTAYKVPRRVFSFQELPLSMIGKVLRRQVRDQILARTSPETTK